MLPSKNPQPRLLLAILALMLLSIPSGELVSGDVASPSKTAHTPAIQSDSILRSPCPPTLVAPEGMSSQESEVLACEAAPAANMLPDLAAKPHRRGFCRCSCGAPCQTNADCGGSSCDPFITCC
jgi:hypothetical protein